MEENTSYLTISAYLPELSDRVNVYQKMFRYYFRSYWSHRKTSIHHVFANITFVVVRVTGSPEKCNIIAQELKEEIGLQLKKWTKPLKVTFKGVQTTRAGKHYACLEDCYKEDGETVRYSLLKISNVFWHAADKIALKYSDCVSLDRTAFTPCVTLFKKFWPSSLYKRETLPDFLKNFIFGEANVKEVALAINAKTRVWSLRVYEEEQLG